MDKDTDKTWTMFSKVISVFAKILISETLDSAVFKLLRYLHDMLLMTHTEFFADTSKRFKRYSKTID